MNDSVKLDGKKPGKLFYFSAAIVAPFVLALAAGCGYIVYCGLSAFGQ